MADEPGQQTPGHLEAESVQAEAAAEAPEEAPAAYEPTEQPWEEPEYVEYPEETYEEPAYEAPYEEAYEEGSPESYGWRPLPENSSVPLGAAIVGILALAVLAYARLDGLIATLDFDPFTRGVARAIAQEVGTILLGGTLLVTGLTAGRLAAGAKIAMAIVGALILLGGPFIAL